MKKTHIKESFDRYVNLLLKKSFNIHGINEDFSGGIEVSPNFKGDAMSGNKQKQFSTFVKGDAMSGNMNNSSGKYSNLYRSLNKNKTYDFSSYMTEYKTEIESSKNINSFLYMLQKMDDERMRKNIDMLADAMITSEPNTQANRDFNKNYKQKGITTKEQLVQVIYKEVIDRKNYRPDPNM